MERGWQCSNLKRSITSSNICQVPVVVVVRVVRSYVSWLNSNQAQFQFWDLCFLKSDNLLSTYFEKLPVIKQWFQLYKCLCKSNFKSGSILNSAVMIPKSNTVILLDMNKWIEMFWTFEQLSEDTGNDFWIGLLNPSHLKNPKASSGVLVWEDGTPLEQSSSAFLDIFSDRGHRCHRFRNQRGIGEECHKKKSFLCQYNCNDTISKSFEEIVIIRLVSAPIFHLLDYWQESKVNFSVNIARVGGIKPAVFKMLLEELKFVESSGKQNRKGARGQLAW